MLLIGVKGHAGMSPCRNFGMEGQAKKGAHKNKNNTPTWRKKNSRKAFKWWKKAPHKKKNVAKRPPHREKSSRKAFKWRKRPPKRRKT